MTPDMVLRILREAVMLVLILSAAPMLAGMIIGLVVSVFQATTQIQEQTLSFVPKMLGIFLTLAIAGPWMLRQAVAFTTVLFDTIAQIK